MRCSARSGRGYSPPRALRAHKGAPVTSPPRIAVTGAHQEALPAITEQVFLFYLAKLCEHGVVPAAEAGADAVVEVKEMVDPIAAVA